MYEKKKRFQNKIAESRFSLVVTAFLCTCIWLLSGMLVPTSGWDLNSMVQAPLSSPILVTLPCLALSTYLIVELNNSNSLIRIYSRMVSCTFLVMMTMATFQYTSIRGAVIALCTAFTYVMLFHCYQSSQSAGRVYYAFLSVGVASIFCIQVVAFIPILWILTATKLYAMNIKSFLASLFGLLTPYWFLGTYAIATGQQERLVNHFTEIATFAPLFDYSMLSLQQIVTGAFIVLCAIIGITHYLRTRQRDRIRTQMLYEIFIIADIFAIALIALQPQHYEPLLGIVVINTAPIFAHFIALTQTKWTNILTIVLMLLSLIITLGNLWEHSLTF